MLTSKNQIIQFLDDQQIPFQHISHPAVFTCDEAARLRPMDDIAHEAISTKNLFLCDKKGRRNLLVMTDCDKRLNLKDLAASIGVNKLRFGSLERLHKYLGVTQGAVTVLGLINDVEHAVELWIDEDIWKSAYFLCHPLVNTATLILSKSSLKRFFKISGHKIHLVRM